MRNLFFIVLTFLSCTSDYELYEKKEWTHQSQIDTETEISYGDVSDDPDIEIDFLSTSGLEIKPGCCSSGRFQIKNVGGSDLIISDISTYASMPTDITISSNYTPLPITLISGDVHEIPFDVNQSDNINDEILLMVSSNDPDEGITQKTARYLSVPGDIVKEEFVIQESKSADVLMVVDNSCSMREEQSELSSNAEIFIDKLSIAGIDYRIAVITTDDDRFVGPIITNLTIDPAFELSNQVNVGTLGSPDERGILQASKSLSPTGMAAPGGSFLRREARLSIIWISDEDDFSGGTTYGWSSDFWSKKASPGDVSVWGIIGDPTYGCITASPGDAYLDLITAMGGNWTSICSTDWGAPMSAVAGSIGVDSTLELTGDPVPSSIRVFVNGIESYDWVYVVSINSVSFNPGHAPAIGTPITVEYSGQGGCN